MIERLALVLPTAALVLWALWCARHRNALSPSVLALAITGVISVFYPVASLLVEPFAWRHAVHLPDEFVLSAQGEYLAFAVGLCAVIARVRLTRRRVFASPTARERDPVAVRQRDRLVAYGLIAGGGLLYAIYIAKVGLGPLTDRSNFAEKYRVSSGLGTFYAGLSLMIVGCLWAEASELPNRTKRLFRVCAGGILAWTLLVVAIRSYAVALVLGYLYLWAKRRDFRVSSVRPSLILSMFLAFVGVEMYSLLRGMWEGSISSAVVALQDELPHMERTLGRVVGGSEFSHPFLTMMELDRYERAGELGGSSYVDGVAVLAPVWLVKERGISVAQQFVNAHYPEFAARGGGTAFCFVGEAWWNFGSILGPLLAGLALGWLLMWAERSARLDPRGLVPRLLPYSLHLILLVHRNSFSSLLKQAVAVGLPVALLLVASSLLWNGLRGRRSLPALTPQGVR